MPAAWKIISWLCSQFLSPCLSSMSVWNFFIPRCFFVGPNKWISLGSKSEVRAVRRVVHDFSAHCCHCCLHQICHIFDEHCLLNCLVHIILKQDTVILCINYYTMWKKINMNHSLWTPNTLAMILLADNCVLNFLGHQETCCTTHTQLHVIWFLSILCI
jgi:hypothetical protein